MSQNSSGTDSGPQRCGFVAVLGAPNAGKSTLVNALVGSKVSIVSPKVQTTRRRILGVALLGAAQLILIDTPGIFAPKRRLDRAMVAAAWQGAQEADLLMLMVDAKRGIDDETRRIIDRLMADKRRALLVLNKIDLIEKPRLLELAAEMDRLGAFDAIFMVSALTGDGIADLSRILATLAPAGPWHFPEDQLSDLPLRDLAAEITREQLYLQLRQELPYSATVETDAWEDRKDGSLRLDQTIWIVRDSQKPIVLGEKGARVKSIGQASRKELEQILERRVHLFLHVKVRENWQEDRERYRAMGLEFDV